MGKGGVREKGNRVGWGGLGRGGVEEGEKQCLKLQVRWYMYIQVKYFISGNIEVKVIDK